MKNTPKFKNLKEYFDYCWDSVPSGKHRLECLAKYFPHSPLEGIYDLLEKNKIPFKMEKDNYKSTIIEFPSMKKKRKYQTRKIYIK